MEIKSNGNLWMDDHVWLFIIHYDETHSNANIPLQFEFFYLF